MNNKLRILLLVAEPLRGDDGGGNTAINFFRGMDAEFAQIYCSDLYPDNDFCFQYYQIRESDQLRNFLRHRPVGKKISWPLDDIEEQDVTSSSVSPKWLQKVKQLRWNCFITARYIMTIASNWKTVELKKFIKDFDPDVIYAPCYASPFLLSLTRYVKKVTGKKILTWSADDNYSLRQFSFSPFFWLNRFIVRHCLRKTYPFYDAVFSISEDEIKEMEPIIKKEIKILRKGIDIQNLPPSKDSVHKPIRMIYAGGIYIQRWKTLEAIGKVLKEINKDEVRMVLDIYTPNQLSDRQRMALNDGRNIFVHKAVNQDELRYLYAKSDIAIHCESFSIKNKLSTRLSFSTKIIDCLGSGCAILAVAWKEQTGLKYLKSQDAALCITDINQLKPVLEELVEDENKILYYAKKARECGIKNHNKDKIQKELFDALTYLGLGE